MKAIKLSVITAAVLLSTSAMANVVVDAGNNVVEGAKGVWKSAKPAAVSLEVGTLGYGANVSWGVNDSVDLQAGWAGADFDVDTNINTGDSYINWGKVLGEEYSNYKGNLKADVKMNNPYLVAQVRPFKNWLTVGAGVVVPKHEINATLVSNTATEITVDGARYDVAAGDVISVKAENDKKLAPVVTVGFRPNIHSRFGVFGEVGATYVGKYDVHASHAPASNTHVINQDSGKTLNQALSEKAADNNISWYPVAKIGATLRF